MDAMIAVEHLTKRYKKAATPAVDDVSFEVAAGRAVRLPRSERGGEDDHHLDPDDDTRQDERHDHDRRPRPRSRPDRRPA